MDGIHSLARIGSATVAASHTNSAGPATRSRPSDEVVLSDSARQMSRLLESDAARHDLVLRVRAAIAAGTYETPRKITVTVERLARDLA
jgi:anti-sigma28 factor (negative regulator of flagellin synthesis)